MACAGVLRGKRLALNPGRMRLASGERGVFCAVSQAALEDALRRPLSRPLRPAHAGHALDPRPPAVLA
jgi:hypothetical protein